MILKIILIILISCACLTGRSWAYNEDTVHLVINEKAVSYSSLEAYLRTKMGMPEGVNELYEAKSIKEWIIFGGTREDVPEIRGLNHYHDPFKPWESAVLWGTGVSSIIWAQDQSGSMLGPWMSWKFARDTYV